MIDVVACPGWWLGLSGRVTLSAKVAMCHVNVSRRVTRLTRVAFMLHLQAPTTSPKYPRVVKIVRKRNLFFEHG